MVGGMSMEAVCSFEDYALIRETKEYRNMPFAFSEHINQNKKLSQSAKIAWAVLHNYSVIDAYGFSTCMSLKTLGLKIGKDKRTAARVLKELEEYGYLSVIPGQEGEKATIYVRFPESVVKTILKFPDRRPSTMVTEIREARPVNHYRQEEQDVVQREVLTSIDDSSVPKASGHTRNKILNTKPATLVFIEGTKSNNHSRIGD